MGWLIYSLFNSFFDSLSSALNKRGAQKINVLSAAWSQRFFALFILLPLALFFGSFQSVNATFWIALLTSSTLNTISSLLFVKSIKDSPLSLTLPITTFTPVFLLITSPIIVGEFPKPLGIAGILSVVVGSYVLNLNQRSNGFFEPILAIFKNQGPRLMLLVAIIWSITSNFDKIIVKNSNPILASLALNLSVTTFLSLILVLKNISVRNVFRNYRVLAPIGIATGLSISFQMIAISMTLVANVISVKRSSALFSVLWGKIFFRENNIKERLTGTVVMILGVILIALA